MRKLIVFVVMVGLLAFAGAASADTYKTYDPDDSVDYALENYDRTYGSSGSQNNFYDYSGLSGGNCTNFVSQCIMAGFVGSDYSPTVYGQRYNYDVDASGGSYQWYFRSDADRGPAFTGTDKLYEYAENNASNYKGLHFDYVTNDTIYEYMDYEEVEEGDVIFADWDHDGTFDHSMLVTNIQTWRSGYNEIRLTYQGAPNVIGKTNIGLGDLNEDYDYEAVFYVYRPTDYNPSGL